MANEAHKFLETNLIVANNGTASAAFSLQPWTTFAGVYFPAMDNGAIGIEYSLDGSTYVPILDPADGNDLVLVTSGQDPAWIDISDYIRAIPRGTGERFLRLTCATQSSGAVTLILTEAS